MENYQTFSHVKTTQEFERKRVISPKPLEAIVGFAFIFVDDDGSHVGLVAPTLDELRASYLKIRGKELPNGIGQQVCLVDPQFLTEVD